MSALIAVLRKEPALFPRFVLPSGWEVPEHYQVREVGYVHTVAVDSEGKERVSESCTVQLRVDPWETEFQPTAGAFLQILARANQILPHDDVELRIIYEGHAPAELTVEDIAVAGAYIDITLIAEEPYPAEHQREQSCT